MFFWSVNIKLRHVNLNYITKGKQCDNYAYQLVVKVRLLTYDLYLVKIRFGNEEISKCLWEQFFD